MDNLATLNYLRDLSTDIGITIQRLIDSQIQQFNVFALTLLSDAFHKLANFECDGTKHKELFINRIDQQLAKIDPVDQLSVNQLFQQIDEYDFWEDHIIQCQNVIDEIKEIIKCAKELPVQYSKDGTTFYNITKIDSQKVYTQLVDPISNQKRVEILFAMYRGKHRFKDLEKILKLQAGHLIYHLNPLKERNFITQDENRIYMLTDKGITVVQYLMSLYNRFF